MKTGDKVKVDGVDEPLVYLYTNKYGRYVTTSICNWNLGYININDDWDEIKPAPRTEIRVKKASEIMKWLEENAKIDDYGDWICHPNSAFTRSMWKYCGKKPSTAWMWNSEWLEEVEI